MFNKCTQCLSLILLAVTVNCAYASSEVVGLWQTGKGEIGYLHISIEPCEESLCGTIAYAFDPEGNPNPNYEHIGKQMVWNMRPKSESSWGNGKIWDPVGGNTYKSKMSVNGDVLSVSGCFLFYCRAQDWKRVE